MTYKFTGQVNCDKCKFFRVCKAGESNCPYMAGWEDGQTKLSKWLEEPCDEHPMIWEDLDDSGKYPYHSHRKDCFRCWQGLKEEK